MVLVNTVRHPTGRDHQGIGYTGSGSQKSQHVSVPNEVFLFSGIDVF